MRDFRDAKTMAQTLRESLTSKAVNISHSESLELVSKMLGVSDWNTLSALLQADRRDTEAPVANRQTAVRSYPAVPLRDLVPFPTATYPLFVGREKSMHALNQAFERQREVVLAVQKDGDVGDPGFHDVYDVGVLARLLEISRLADGKLRVQAQAHRRVVIRRFIEETGAFQAEVADINEGRIPDAPFLIKRAVIQFESYATARKLQKTWPQLDRIRDPGRVADIISTHMVLPIGDKQRLLATLDPVMRLERVDALLHDSALPFSPTLVVTRRRALDYANQRSHQYATLEHLLLALIDDADASAVMQACDADLGTLRASLLSYLDKDLKRLVIPIGINAIQTDAFLRVTRRAERHAQELGQLAVTGANALMGIFPETRSPAAHLLGEQGVSQERAADFIAHDIGKEA